MVYPTSFTTFTWKVQDQIIDTSCKNRSLFSSSESFECSEVWRGQKRVMGGKVRRRREEKGPTYSQPFWGQYQRCHADWQDPGQGGRPWKQWQHLQIQGVFQLGIVCGDQATKIQEQRFLLGKQKNTERRIAEREKKINSYPSWCSIRWRQQQKSDERPLCRRKGESNIEERERKEKKKKNNYSKPSFEGWLHAQMTLHELTGRRKHISKRQKGKK